MASATTTALTFISAVIPKKCNSKSGYDSSGIDIHHDWATNSRVALPPGVVIMMLMMANQE